MKVVFWMTWRELINRKTSLVISMLMIAVMVSLCLSTELISMSRENNIGTKLDYIGPTLRLTPVDSASNKLMGMISVTGNQFFKESFVNKMQKDLSQQIRALERRLVVKKIWQGLKIPVIGINSNEVVSAYKTFKNFARNEAVLGSELAKKTGKKLGESIMFQGYEFRIIGIQGTTGTKEDLALFFSLKDLQTVLALSGVVNEIRIFKRFEISVKQITNYISINYPKVNVINLDRGATVEDSVGFSLKKHRWAIYLITFFTMALCILILSYLNTSERRLETSSLVAIGTSKPTIFYLLVLRAVILGLSGSLFGFFFSFLVLSVQNFDFNLYMYEIFNLMGILGFSVFLLSILGSAPVSIVCAVRNHVNVLQE